MRFDVSSEGGLFIDKAGSNRGGIMYTCVKPSVSKTSNTVA